MQNYYAQDLTQPRHASLSGRLSCKVCIVGAGFAGLHTALSLLERGVSNVVIIDAEHVGFGASGRNGGFVFAGYSLGERALLQRMGPELARRWYGKTQDAVRRIRALVKQYEIACDCVDAGVLWANWFHDETPLRSRQALLADHFDTHWQHISKNALREMIRTERYSGALFERNAMHLNPLKLAQGLAHAAQTLGAQIYEATPAVDLRKDGSGWCIRTPNGSIQAEHVIVAGGGYLNGAGPAIQTLRRALLPIATYVVATAPLGAKASALVPTDAAIYDTRFAFDYYRRARDTRLIWGGRISIRNRSPTAIAKLLRDDIGKVFPSLAQELLDAKPEQLATASSTLQIDYAWGGLMSYARHEMPQIGQLATGLWYAQAFGGHGLAPTCVAGETLANAIALNNPEFLELAQFGLSRTYGAIGMLAAQMQYSWAQWQDAWHARMQIQA